MTLKVQSGATNGVNGTINVSGGPLAGGGGGTIDLHNKGTGGINITNGNNLVFAPGIGGGDGGRLSLNAGKGPLTISTGTLNANASGPGNYRGGRIDLRGTTITVTGGSTALTANGVGQGNGGNIIVETTTGNITLGGIGDIGTISATGGSINGSTGGNVTVSAGGLLTLGSTINVASTAANGNGGNITLAAGSAVPGTNLDVIFNGASGTNLNTSGTGTGSGGNIALISSGNIILSGANNAPGLVSGGGKINIIAGTAFTSAGRRITIAGASSTGGYITSANGHAPIISTGGNILMVAYAGSGTLSGGIGVVDSMPITSGGTGAGINGDVTIIAGGVSPSVINLSTINTAGGGGGGGNVTIIGAQPVINGTLTIINGKITTGSLSPGIDPASDIITGAITTSSGNVLIAGGANVTTSTITTGFWLPTSSGFGNGFGNSGSVNITSSGGALNLGAISTNGLVPGNFAGNITLTAPGGITIGDINANGYISSTGGIITITTPGAIVGTFINATGSLGGSAGSIFTTSSTLSLSGTNGYGDSVDASSGGGNAGNVSITTTSSQTFIVGGNFGGNGVAADIRADGLNGGFVTLTNYGNSNTGNQIINGSVSANGTTGFGGMVLFQGQQPAGSAPLISTIDGFVEATNFGNNSGIIGFNGGPGQNISLFGTGFVDAGNVVRIGNLNPTTLAFQSPSAGRIFISPSLHLGNRVEPSLTPTTFSRPTTTVPNFLDLSKTAVDYTPFHRFPYIDPYNNPPSVFQLAARNTNLALIPGTKFFNHNFEGSQLSKLIKDGLVIASNTGNNYLNIDRGNVLLSPKEDIVVGTHEGNVYVSSGATLFLMESGHDVVLYDLCQSKPKQVSVVVNKHKLFLEPGLMLVLTRQNTQNFEDINADCHYVNYTNVKLLNIGEQEVKAFMANFSTSSAVLSVEPLQQLLASSEKEDKSVLNQIAKSAVIMGGFSTQLEPAAGTQIAAKQPTNSDAGIQAIHPGMMQIGTTNRQVTK